MSNGSTAYMSDTVEQIKERVSIVDVVSPYVELHKAGKNYKGKSPFTSERTPSFFVSPDRNMYYCFSTSKGGDIFTFVQEMEGVDFKGALKILAEKAGIELVPEDPKKRSERDQLYTIMEAATVFYQSKLRGHTAAGEYIKKRGVQSETARLWRLGYAPGPPEAGWRELATHLEQSNYVAAMLLLAGLCKKSEQGKEPYDVFRDRIMFPICDPSGRVIAFSGRLLSKDSEAPKYVNSPDTPLFNKSEALFGYDKAKQGIRKFDFSLIVEGQFDVVLAHQAGYTNAVAVSGTSLTPHHVALLQRLSNRVVLALDADRAGIAAVKRAADVMLVRGMDVKVAKLPAGKDPADLVEESPKEFKALIGKSTHVIEFLLAVLKANAKDERSFKLTAQDEIIPYVLRIQNHIDRDHFEQVVADALHTTKDAVHLEVVRQQEAKQSQPSTRSVETKTNTTTAKPSQHNSRYQDLLAYVAVIHELITPNLQDRVTEVVRQHAGVDLVEVVSSMSPEQKSALLFTLESHYDALSEKQQKAELNEKLQELRLLSLRHALRQEKDALYAAERNGESTDAVMEVVTNLQHQLAIASQPTDFFVDDNASPDVVKSRAGD